MHGASVQVYTELFTDATPERLEALFKYLDRDNSGVVDFLSWSRGLRLQDVPQARPPCHGLVAGANSSLLGPCTARSGLLSSRPRCTARPPASAGALAGTERFSL